VNRPLQGSILSARAARRLLVALLGLALAVCLLRAHAETASSPEQLFRAGLSAVERGAYDEAIDHFELLADRGFVHPDASYNRGVAYVQRATSSAARPGDLGRAAAALNETVLQRPKDEAAERALEGVRSEIARRRAREGASALMVQRKLLRAVVELFSEDVWAIGAVIGSALLTVGLLVLRLATKSAVHLAGTLIACLSGLVLLVCGTFTAIAQHYRRTTEPAVVVASDARLLDDSGAPLSHKLDSSKVVSIPEGARVDVLEKRGTLVRVEWGTTQGFITLGQIRLLERPR
jgi:hypothetical protein